jgi:Predicted transcriptional regulators
MERKKELVDELYPDCPIRNIIYRITSKWALLVLYTLSTKEVFRFKELQRAIPDISQKMLASTLRTLEEDGYVSRTIFPEVPPRVEYRLTDRAITLLPHIQGLIIWAKDNFSDIIKNRAAYMENNY